MHLEPRRIDVLASPGSATAATMSAALAGDGTVALGPLEVEVHAPTAAHATWTWSVANRGDLPVAVQAVRLVFGVDGARSPLRMFRHGYQSWSASGLATLGVDTDPSRRGRSSRLLRATHHADEEPAGDGELRSEMVTLLAGPADGAGGDGAVVLVGFVGGSTHDGTLRLRDVSGPGGRPDVELAAEAFLGGARLDAGTSRRLHPVVVAAGPDPEPLLEQWADAYGATEHARTAAPYQVGWCSWYHYFGAVTERDVRANLARAGDWPFDVFQVDDGYQAAIGDWLRTAPTFPAPLEALAATIADAGRRPGIWIAPFVAAPSAPVATEHPDWIARYRDGTPPLIAMGQPAWGGAVHTLDTTRPEVLEHLRGVAAGLVERGFTYLKLDFTYAPGLGGVYSDPTRTPAERVRAGYDAVRRGAGSDAFLLGCGAPLGAVVGVVDGNRIGPDVGPYWHRPPEPTAAGGPPGGPAPGGAYASTLPATANAWAATLSRSFLHRRLWVNDPDCLMLRRTGTDLSADAVRAWAWAVAVSGGMALVSDDLGLLDRSAHGLLDEVLALGRAADADAAAGRTPRCPDRLDEAVPHRLRAAGHELDGDPVLGRASLRRWP